MNAKCREKQRGFGSMIGLLVTVVVATMFALAQARGLSAQNKARLTDLTAQQITTIFDAASTYLEHRGEWPDEDDGCTNALGVMKNRGYLIGLPENAPWGRPYRTSCDADDPKVFAVNTYIRNSAYARRLANNLATAELSDDDRRVTSYLSRSLILAALTGKLIQSATYSTNRRTQIDKPECPSQYTPRIFGAFSGMSASYNAPSIGGAYMRVIEETNDYWRVIGELTTTTGTSAPVGERVQMMIMTMCQPASNDPQL